MTRGYLPVCSDWAIARGQVSRGGYWVLGSLQGLSVKMVIRLGSESKSSGWEFQWLYGSGGRERESVTQRLKVINFQSLASKYLEKERERERDLWDPLAVFFCTAKMVARTPQKHKKMVETVKKVITGVGPVSYTSQISFRCKMASGLNEIQWLG